MRKEGRLCRGGEQGMRPEGGQGEGGRKVMWSGIQSCEVQWVQVYWVQNAYRQTHTTNKDVIHFLFVAGEVGAKGVVMIFFYFFRWGNKMFLY